MWPQWHKFPDYTRIMTRLSTRIGPNMAECAKNAIELRECATELLDFGQIWTRIIAEIEKKKKNIYIYIYFPGGIYGCAGAVFWPIAIIWLNSTLYSDGDSDGFWELFGAFWADSAIFVLFGSIWLYPYHTTTTNPTNCQESRNTWVRGCIVGNSRSS